MKCVCLHFFKLFFLSLKIAYEMAPRRSGDIASCYADPRLAEVELGWKADFGLERMCTYLCTVVTFIL